MKEKHTLTRGNVGRQLIMLTSQMTFGMFAVILFNLIDTFFISMLGTIPLAALSFTFPVLMLVGSIAMALGTGVSALISREVGRGKSKKVRSLSSSSISLTFITASILAFLGLASMEHLFTAMGASDAENYFIQEYMQIWYAGLPFFFLPMVANTSIRALGDMKTPSLIMSVAVILNAILDPLLIFGAGPLPAMGMQGAALATVAARFMTMILSFYILLHREKIFSFRLLMGRETFSNWKKILYIAIPSASANIIIPLSNGMITRFIAAYGSAAVAGFGIASKIETFALSIVMALAAVLGPFIGQNVGARLYQRVSYGIQSSHVLVMSWGFFIFIAFQFIAAPLASLFSQETEVIHTAISYLSLVSIAYGFHGIIVTTNTTLNVLNRPLHASTINLFQSMLIYVPFAWLASKQFAITGIFYAAIAAKVLGGLTALFIIRRIIKKRDLKLPKIRKLFSPYIEES